MKEETIIIGGLEVTIGPGGDMTEEDLAALVRQHEAQAARSGRVAKWPLGEEHALAIVRVMLILRGSRIVDTEPRK